ncbi:MAG: zinc-ribbon domain-containing protein [Bryobacteraceae bacterium]
MPFCTNCGTNVDPAASFCYHCGTAQPRPAVQSTDVLDNIGNRTACILCYIPVFGVIPAIVFLASHKFRGNTRVRFDAFQSLYLFLAWLIVSSAIPVFFFHGPGWGIEHPLVGLLKFAMFICWIYLLVKAAQEQQVKLPIIGDLAARSMTEQF